MNKITFPISLFRKLSLQRYPENYNSLKNNSLNILSSLIITLGLLLPMQTTEAQSCNLLSGNVNLGGAGHANGFQEVNATNAATKLSNGNFVVCWDTRDGIDGDEYGAYFQVFEPDGTPVTGVTMPYGDINASGVGFQGRGGPKVVALSTGFVIAFESEDGPGDTGPAGDDQQDILYRVYNNSGTSISATTRLSVANEEDQLEYVLPLSTGGFVIGFSIDEDNTGNKDDFFFRSYNASGVATSGVINISGGAHDAAFQAKDNEDMMADLGGGNFVIAWQGRDDIDGDGNGGFFRVFNANGTAITGVIMPYADINAGGTGDQASGGPKVKTLNNGNFIIAWESEQGPGDVGPGGAFNDDQDLYFRIYSSTGAPIAGTSKVNSDNTSDEEQLDEILILSGGNIAILYHRDEDEVALGDNKDDLFVRVFSEAGTVVSASFEISSGAHLTGFSTVDSDGNALAALDNGNFVVSWATRDAIDGDDAGAFFRVFNASGGSVSTVIMPYADINPSGTGKQSTSGPIVKALNGGFMVGWQSLGGSGDTGPATDEQDVYHRVYDNTGTAICGSTKTNTSNDSQEEILDFVLPLDNAKFVMVYRTDEDTPIGNNKDDFFIRVIGDPVSFSAPADLCIDAGNQTGLGGGSPIGGVYSGIGVTDDGNGTTYSFNPATAGVSTQTLTYTQGGFSATDNIQVFALPTVTFTTLADVCINEGVQAGLGGGSPSGGIYSGAGVTDDGNGTTYSFDPAAVGVGTHTITYNLIDTNGCSGSATDDVEVFPLPVVTFTTLADLCLNAGVQAGLGGGSSTGGTYSGPGVTDDGNGISYSFDPAAAGIGTHIITYTVSVDGCTNSATDNVEVHALPAVTFNALADLCIDAGVQAGLGGGTTSGGVYSGPGVTDSGNGMTYSFNPAVAGVGTHILTYTFTDTNGCANSATDNVEVFALPTVTFTAHTDLCVDAGVQALLGGGSPTGGVYSGAGVTDDGNGMTFSFNPDAAGVGTHTISYSFTDGNGCTNSTSDDVEVFDLPVVTFTAPAPDVCIEDATVTGLGGGLPTGGVYSGTGVTDDGNGTTFSFDPTATAPAGGNIMVIYTFTDTNGCTNSVNDNIFVNPVCCALIVDCSNITDMVITCRADLPPVDFDLPIITDSCGNVTLSALTIIPGNSGCPGDEVIIPRTYFIQDADGNMTQCTQTFTVRSDNGPTITPTLTAYSENLDANCEFIIPNYAALANSTADCGTATITQSPTAGTVINGAIDTIITLTATDTCGRTAMTDITLTTIDNIPPTVITKNITVQLDSSGKASINATSINNLSTDNCGIASFSVDTTSFTCIDVGENTVTLTVTDINGNIASNTAIITIEDNMPPTAICKNITVQLDENGEVLINPNDLDNGSTDNCEILNIGARINGITRFSEQALDCSNIGENSIELFVVDTNGNVSNCIAIVTVEDKIAPTVTTQNITVQLGDNGTVSITTDAINNGSSDNCEIETMVLDTTTFDCTAIGENLVTLTVTDVNGNSADAVAVVTVEDSMTPTVIAQNITVELDAGGTATITADQINNGSSDNCEIDSMSIDVTSFDCATIGENNVTLTVTDVNGNSANDVAIVTVEDSMAPTVVAQNITVELDASGTATITADNIDNGSSDNCEIETLELDTTTFDCTNLGENTVILTAIDINGNNATETAIVTVLDNIDPTVNTKNITVTLGADGTATITTDQIDNGSSDNCEIESMSLNVTSFDCATIGENVVTLTVTDVNGNSANATTVVTVEESIAPIANCAAPFKIQLDETGNASITVEDINNGSSDNCGIQSMRIDVTSFDCTTIGENTVTLTVTDTSGNSSMCTTIVTVEDMVPPIVITQNISVELDSNGNANISAEDIDDGSFDACGIASLSIDQTSFNCPTLGDNTITLTVVDNNGNTASEMTVVTFTSNDLDNDGIADSCDLDIDGDNVDNDIDNCPTVANPNQADLDRNGIGDICDSGELEIPKGFSPNGDGTNDEFIIKGLHKYPNNSIQIYNRYGNMVYESNNYQNYWDGVSSGKTRKLPAAPYFYVLSVNGGTQIVKGWLYINY